MKPWIDAIDAEGFAVVPSILPPDLLADVIAGLGNSPHAIRNLIEAAPAVGELARRPECSNLAGSILGTGAFVARALLFDKTPASNWKVVWHQDLTIAVRERREVPGFGPWSEKAGIPHVQPPTDVLERMLTLRTPPRSVRPGRTARYASSPARTWPGSSMRTPSPPGAARAREGVCLADRGGVVMMRPLLLHASSLAAAPAHRRVVHLEFAVDDLPGGLEWHGRW